MKRNAIKRGRIGRKTYMSLRLRTDLRERIRVASEEEDRTQTVIIERALDRYFAEQDRRDKAA